MIGRDNAREYLQRRVAEHDLGVANGNSMTPDEVAMATLLLDVDERLDAILERLDRRCCAWAGNVIVAVAENKAALGLIAALLAMLAALLDSISKIIRGG